MNQLSLQKSESSLLEKGINNMNSKISKYPDAMYRVSLKAIIRNEKGEVLCVQEGSRAWSLPGGGMDHGETEREALARELKEEIAYEGVFSFRPVGVEPRYMSWKQAYLLWVVYEVECESLPPAIAGVDALDAAYLDVMQFRESKEVAEQLVYKWAIDRSHIVESAI